MSSSYLTLCQKLRQEVGATGSDGTPSTVIGQTRMLKKIVDWIADADMDICTKYLDWGFLHDEHSVSTVAGVKDYSAPSDFGLWDYNSFYLDSTSDSYQKLNKMDYSYWRSHLRNGTKTNEKPTWFIVKPNKDIILESPPDGTYTLTADYYKTATRMTTNDSVSLIPTKFDRLIIARAKIYYGNHQNAAEIIEDGVNEYRDLMMRLESIYLPEQESRTKGGNDDMVTIVE